MKKKVVRFVCFVVVPSVFCINLSIRRRIKMYIKCCKECVLLEYVCAFGGAYELNWNDRSEQLNRMCCYIYAHDTVAVDRTLCAGFLYIFLFYFLNFFSYICGCHQCRCALLLLASCTNA